MERPARIAGSMTRLISSATCRIDCFCAGLLAVGAAFQIYYYYQPRAAAYALHRIAPRMRRGRGLPVGCPSRFRSPAPQGCGRVCTTNSSLPTKQPSTSCGRESAKHYAAGGKQPGGQDAGCACYLRPTGSSPGGSGQEPSVRPGCPAHLGSSKLVFKHHRRRQQAPPHADARVGRDCRRRT